MVYGVKNKPGVSLVGLQPVMRKAILAVAREMAKYEIRATISGGTETANIEGIWYHSPGSLHPYGLALDFSLKEFPRSASVISDTIDRIREQLGEDYDVVRYVTHIHIEYDPK